MPTATNDITGDSIQSRISNEKYETNFDNIFQKKQEIVYRTDGVGMAKCPSRCWLEIKDDNFFCSKPNCSGNFNPRN